MTDPNTKKKWLASENDPQVQSGFDYATRFILLFECADNCKTILDVAHLKEIRRFMEFATTDPLWEKICYKKPGSIPVDGYGCSAEAY